MWSGPTPAGGITAEIVDIQKGSDTERQDLRGKLALMDQNPANLKSSLGKAGALGAINAFTENPGLREGRQWISRDSAANRGPIRSRRRRRIPRLLA